MSPDSFLPIILYLFVAFTIQNPSLPLSGRSLTECGALLVSSFSIVLRAAFRFCLEREFNAFLKQQVVFKFQKSRHFQMLKQGIDVIKNFA